MNLPPFPSLPSSPQERLRWIAWGEECYRQALEDASWACGAVAFDGCHEWRREAVNKCLAAISALLRKEPE